MAQAGLAVAALITALAGLAFGIVGLIRSARAEEAKNTADLSKVGLEAVKVGMATQDRLLGEALRQVAELRGELRQTTAELGHCKDEREAAAARAEEIATRSEALAVELADLKRRLQP